MGRAACLGVLLLLHLGCGPSETPTPVKIAISIASDLHGSQDILHGVEIALAEAEHRAGSIPVEAMILDLSQREPELSLLEREDRAAREAVADPRVVAYLGPAATTMARVSMPILNRAEMTQISQAATWPGLTKPGFAPGEPALYYPLQQRHFFRMVPTDDLQGAVAALWAQEMGATTVAVVDDGTAYGRGLTGIFEVAAHDQELEIIHRSTLQTFHSDPGGRRQVAAFIAAAAPDLVYVGGGANPPALDLLRHLRSLAPQQEILVSDAFLRQEVLALAAELEGLRLTSAALLRRGSMTPFGLRFAQQYRQRFGREPLPIAVATYAATRVLLRAIQEAETADRAGVLRAMHNLGTIQGPLGDWRFDEAGDTSLRELCGLQLQGGEWVLVREFSGPAPE